MAQPNTNKRVCLFPTHGSRPQQCATARVAIGGTVPKNIMPTSARKSSLGGARRGPQKAHIPYRGDNPEVGKKTGIAVQHVEPKSDGFEPFEEVIQQADGRTPPRPKRRKKSTATPRRDDYYEDEDGEQSMDVDSPVQHLINMRPPSTPTTAGRNRSSGRPVARTSEVDFDEIPSPRPLASSQRTMKNGGPGPSNLSRSTRAREPESESESPDEGPGDYGGGDYGDFDDYGPQENSPEQQSPRRTSFGQIEEDDEEPEEEEPKQTPKGKGRHDKGKRRAEREPSEEHEEEEVEDEIAQGLEDVGLGADTDEEEETTPKPPPRKVKVDEKPKRTSPRKTQSQSKKENKPIREGVRRSRREHIPPLEYWRGERYIYGRSTNSGAILVPQIKEIVRIPKEPPISLGTKRKRGSTRPRSKSRGRDHSEDHIPPALPVANPEEGWDDDTQAKCMVLHYTSKEEIERRIAWTAKMVEPRMAANNNWSFDKIFGDDEFIAAGQLIIPPRGRKPSKAAKDNTYIFYVIEGAVNLKIHETSMILATGGMFMVPRGNTYFIENICQRDAKLFFTQARKVEMNAEELAAKQHHVAETQKRQNAIETQRRKSAVRSSSVGANVSVARTPPSQPLGRAASMAAFPTSRKP
ncbi:unnamed protein product [Cyclocybe aegerita]|uniref:CENP-C homolog n=1 Tax=Cyclocybe aegerita TaxID=1973307 RepID=A0A8S0Y0P3_CYCAE|nr:unnamed protein product [Cyclocybe aegerita]